MGAIDLLARHRKGLEVLAVVGAFVWLVAAGATLIPDPTQQVNRISYHSTCPYAPWSSLVLIGLAAGCLAAIPIMRWLARRFGKTGRL